MVNFKIYPIIVIAHYRFEVDFDKFLDDYDINWR